MKQVVIENSDFWLFFKSLTLGMQRMIYEQRFGTIQLKGRLDETQKTAQETLRRAIEECCFRRYD